MRVLLHRATQDGTSVGNGRDGRPLAVGAKWHSRSHPTFKHRTDMPSNVHDQNRTNLTTTPSASQAAKPLCDRLLLGMDQHAEHLRIVRQLDGARSQSPQRVYPVTDLKRSIQKQLAQAQQVFPDKKGSSIGTDSSTDWNDTRRDQSFKPAHARTVLRSFPILWWLVRPSESPKPFSVIAKRNPVTVSAVKNDVFNEPLPCDGALVTNNNGARITGQHLVAMSVAVIIHDPTSKPWCIGDGELPEDGEKFVALHTRDGRAKVPLPPSTRTV